MTSSLAITCLVVIQLLATAWSLQCFKCSYNDFQSDSSALDFVFNGLSELSNTHCQMLTDTDKYELDLRLCPSPGLNKVYKCGEITGTVYATIAGVDIQYTAVDRDCVEVDVGDSDYSNGCHENEDDLPGSGPVRDLVDETFEGLNLGEVQFTGQSCYESDGYTDNDLQCPKCTWNQLTTGNVFIQWIIDGIEMLSSDHCLLQNLSEDIYEVDSRICRPPQDQGQINRCASIDGQITGEIPIVGIDFTYKTLTRDCESVTASLAADAGSHSDGCLNDDELYDQNAVIGHLLDESHSGVDVDDASLSDGQACFIGFSPLLMAASDANSTSAGLSLLSLATALLSLLSLL